MPDERPREDMQAEISLAGQRIELLRSLPGESKSDQLSYRFKLGRETIQLDPVEFNILVFLSAHPYRAFSRRAIVAGAATQSDPLDESVLDQRIASLRHKLGFFRDYIQTVPYIGYRFKA